MDYYWRLIFFWLLLLLNLVNGESGSESLDNILHNLVNMVPSNHRTGSSYEVVLPSNFSAMKVSVVRIRSSTFWAKGADFSYFNIPQRSVPFPYAKRIAIVYDNLGNLSSHYFKSPAGYSFAAPVIGFQAYDATNVTSLGVNKLKFSDTGYPISIYFNLIITKPYNPNLTHTCMKFSDNGSVIEWTNMTKTKLCFTEDTGHFSVVIPSPTPKMSMKEKDERFWIMWVVGCATGFTALGLLFVGGMIVFRKVKKRRVRKMEEEAEKGVALDRICIRRSVMPSAAMIRTQPTIENDLVP